MKNIEFSINLVTKAKIRFLKRGNQKIWGLWNSTANLISFKVELLLDLNLINWKMIVLIKLLSLRTKEEAVLSTSRFCAINCDQTYDTECHPKKNNKVPGSPT